LRFTQAGHPQGLILRAATKEIIPLATDGKLVGVFKNDKTGFGEEKTSMQVGDKLVLYTDAIVESRNRHNEMLEINVLHDFLIANSTLPISELFDKVYQFGIDFSGKSTYDDDFTLVGLDVLS
jgi:sigma-B regulation protein RsbU (phosphoserine phosphatase)